MKGNDDATMWHLFSGEGFNMGQGTRTIYANYCGELIFVKFKKVKITGIPWSFSNMIIVTKDKRYKLPSTLVGDIKYIIMGQKEIKTVEKNVEDTRNLMADLGQVDLMDAGT